MAAAKKHSGRSAIWLFTGLTAIPLILAPPVIRGLAAEAWVSYYASMDAVPRPRKAAARVVAHKADIAIQSLAPLPQASRTAMRALELAQRLEERDHDREAALLIYRGVRASCAQVTSRPFSGTGFAVIEARAAALEEAAARETSR